jgi:membrane dipeptidase
MIVARIFSRRPERISYLRAQGWLHMDRRDFIAGSFATVCALRVSGAAWAQKQAAPVESVSDPVKALYRRSLVLDALSGPANPDEDTLPLKAEVVKQCGDSGINAVNWTVGSATFDGTVRRIAFAHGLQDSDPARWKIVRRHSDLAAAKREGRIALILGFQFPQPVEEDLNRLTTFHRLGVRIIQMTYNTRGLFGDGCLEPGNAGLSKVGREAIARMNELGIAVDLSHCGKRTTAESIQTSAKPVLITHSACNAIFPHPRHKDDEELRSLASRGGVFGVYMMPYLTPSPKLPTKEDVIRNIEHALKVCGADHVGIGSDNGITAWDESPEEQKKFQALVAERKRLGIGAPGEDRPLYVQGLNTPHRMLLIAEELHRRGHSDDVIEKVLGRNFQRAFGDIWGGA